MGLMGYGGRWGEGGYSAREVGFQGRVQGTMYTIHFCGFRGWGYGPDGVGPIGRGRSQAGGMVQEVWS